MFDHTLTTDLDLAVVQLGQDTLVAALRQRSVALKQLRWAGSPLAGPCSSPDGPERVPQQTDWLPARNAAGWASEQSVCPLTCLVSTSRPHFCLLLLSLLHAAMTLCSEVSCRLRGSAR